jgi:methylenetetrahydrofolate dehydrogenase (NADP+)/methenyltetrahydrofolate cyclohydrolase
MTAQLLDGQIAAAAIADRLAVQVADIKASRGRSPGLGTILVGDDPASAAYVAAKHRACQLIGIESLGVELPSDASLDTILGVVDDLNRASEVDAFLVQLPLPRAEDEVTVLLAMDPDKDVDGLHPVNLGRLVLGAPGPVPCTPAGIVALLAHYGIGVAGRHVVVVGRGPTVGRPLTLLLSQKDPRYNAAVTLLHTGVPDLAAYTREAEILVVAAGSPGLITRDMVRDGAVVVAAGITRDGRKIIADITEDVAETASWVTPRLGGVGPMTVAMLCANAVRAASVRS